MQSASAAAAANVVPPIVHLDMLYNEHDLMLTQYVLSVRVHKLQYVNNPDKWFYFRRLTRA